MRSETFDTTSRIGDDTSYGLLSMKLNRLSVNYSTIAAANGEMSVSSQISFDIYMSIISRAEVRVPKHTIMAHTKNPATVNKTILSESWRAFCRGPMKRMRKVIQLSKRRR